MAFVINQFQPVNSDVRFGILDKAATGIIGASALITLCDAVMRISLSYVLKSVGFKYKGSILQKAEAYMPNVNFRPYRLYNLEEALVVDGHEDNILLPLQSWKIDKEAS